MGSLMGRLGARDLLPEHGAVLAVEREHEEVRLRQRGRTPASETSASTASATIPRGGLGFIFALLRNGGRHENAVTDDDGGGEALAGKRCLPLQVVLFAELDRRVAGGNAVAVRSAPRGPVTVFDVGRGGGSQKKQGEKVMKVHGVGFRSGDPAVSCRSHVDGESCDRGRDDLFRVRVVLPEHGSYRAGRASGCARDRPCILPASSV